MVKTRVEGRRMERGKWWAPGGPQRRTGQAVAKRENGERIRGRISGILQQNPLILQAGFMARADGRNPRPEWGSLEGRILS
jgi:hypothetical protein